MRSVLVEALLASAVAGLALVASLLGPFDFSTGEASPTICTQALELARGGSPPVVVCQATMSGLDDALERLGLEECREQALGLAEHLERPALLRLDGDCRVRELRSGSVRAATAALLNIAFDANTADEIDFKDVPGIGPRLARRIVTDRKKQGAYCSVEEMQRVRGIGPKKLEALARRVETNCR